MRALRRPFWLSCWHHAIATVTLPQDPSSARFFHKGGSRMETKTVVCPDCEIGEINLNRRGFLKTAGLTAAAATASVPLWATPRVQAAPTTKSAAETAV